MQYIWGQLKSAPEKLVLGRLFIKVLAMDSVVQGSHNPMGDKLM